MEVFFSRILETRLSPNQVYLLHCIKKGVECLYINIHAELRALKVAGYIDKDYRITPNGHLILEKLSDIPKVDIPVTEKPIIEEYLDLWPSIKLPSGKYAKSDRKNIEINFKWFFKTYSYSWDTIIKATEMYIAEYEKKNYLYMRTSQYFIKKQEVDKTITSELANYCMLIENGIEDTGPKIFPEKVF